MLENNYLAERVSIHNVAILRICDERHIIYTTAIRTCMMIPDTNNQLVRQFFSVLESDNPATAGNYLADIFVGSGWTPRPLTKDAFLRVFAALKEGIPNLAFHPDHLRQENETTISAILHITGHQTDSFILPELGTPPIPQTDNSIIMPAEPVKLTIENDLISNLTIQRVAGGGIHGLLRQLGIELIIPQ